jgi:hypothetical protein
MSVIWIVGLAVLLMGLVVFMLLCSSLRDDEGPMVEQKRAAWKRNKRG